MSHRLCANCNRVVNNDFCPQFSCPYCGKEDWADPTEHNDEWNTIYKQQIEIDLLKQQLKKAHVVVDFYGDKYNWDINENYPDESSFIKDSDISEIAEFLNDDGYSVLKSGGRKAREYQEKYYQHCLEWLEGEQYV